MIRILAGHWLNPTPHPLQRGRRRSAPPSQHRRRLFLEPLEGRFVPSTVTNLNDAGAGSLRQAILDTPPGSTVDFQPGLSGTITLTSGELAILKDLTIAGPGPGLMAVSGNHASRVFNIAVTFKVTISGLMITNGQAPSNQSGGGIDNAGTLTVTASILTGNSAYIGGGIQNAGTLTVTDSTVNSNTATGSAGINNDGLLTVTGSTVNSNSASIGGGGIGNSNMGTMTVTDSTIGHNSGGGANGGGIRNLGGAVTLVRSIVTGNSSPGANAGGIDNFNGGMLTVTDSTISDNSSEGGGGGIDNGGPLTVTRSTINDNSCVSGGGGIANFATLTVTDSTFSGNAAGFGGGIANYSGTLTITFSTLSGNHANGGGLGQYGGQMIARDTIFAGNTGGPSPDISGTLTSQGHNLIGNGTGGQGFTASDLVGTSSNPIDPKLGPLQANGGPTRTMALLPGSPAIDAGDNTDAPEWDQRGPGYPRITADDPVIDIGAFEVQAKPTVTCSVARDLLWLPFHQLVNVGLSVDVHPLDADLHLLVYGNDHADPSDATDIAPDTLRLRAERDVSGTGRVYLVVAEATINTGMSFDVCTVVVPRFKTPDDIASVQLQALGAETWYRQYQTAPPGFSLLGEGAPAAAGPGLPNVTVSVASLGQAIWTSQEPPAVRESTVTGTVRSVAPVPLEVQPGHPTLAETVPAPIPFWDARQAKDALFEGWDRMADGLAVNWT